MEEIVVTARRREEILSDLPLSVAALNADAMQAQGIYNIDQIGEFVPNLTFTETNRRHVKAVYIRGIGNDAPINLIPVGTGTYIDGHYLPSTLGLMMSTVDVERVEVLRGPQGTLFGKNTTGGAINVISAKPQNEFEADLLLRVADFGQQDLRGMINVPFSDTVAGRFNIAREVSDGFYFNRTLNTDIGATDLEAFGAAIRITPNDNWLIDLAVRANYQDDDQSGGQCRARPTASNVTNLANMHPDVLDARINDPAEYARIVANHPAQIYTGPVFDDGVNQWGGATRYPDGTRANIGGHLERFYPGATIDLWNACTADNRQGDFVNSQEKDTHLELDNENFNATIQWDSAGELGVLENLNVKLITARHETEINYLQDRDMTFLSLHATGTPPHSLPGSVGSKRTTTTVELLFTGDVNDRTSFIVGTHYFDDETATGGGNCLGIWETNLAAFSDPSSGLVVPCQPDGAVQLERMPERQVPGGPALAPARSGIQGNESIAVYGHLTYDLNTDWTLDVGARWTDEDRFYNAIEFLADGSTCTHSQAGDPPLTTLCAPDYILSHDVVFLNGLYNDTSGNWSEVTPMVSLTRNLGGGGGAIEDGMVYLQYAEGFLSGSFNDELQATLFPVLEPLVPYDPEHVNNYEVGFKGTFADGRLRISSSVFYMDYKDKQEGVGFDNSDGRFGDDFPFLFFTTNAASVDVYGIEFELRASPWNGGFVSLDVGWLDNEYEQFTAFDPDTGEEVDFSNLFIADYSPEWTFNASIEHVFVLGNGATLTPQVGVYWQDDYDFEAALVDSPPSYCFQEAYTKLRTRVTYVPPNENWQASLFGYNIGDERYFENCRGGQSGAFVYRYGPPNQWGVEFNYRWGS